MVGMLYKFRNFFPAYIYNYIIITFSYIFGMVNAFNYIRIAF
jgi:hypothetical protein